MILVKAGLLLMLIKVLDRTSRPFACATLYAMALFTNGLMFDLALGGDWKKIAIQILGSWALASVVFFFLAGLDSSEMPYWGVLIGGLLALLFLF